ncbi:MAG: ABC transporter substrate-binding protein, partial [Pseudomonadota bacterium]
GDIAALSPQAEAPFSYLRAEASGIAKVSARAADILALRPDLVVRSYGGGREIGGFLERAGIPVVQLDFPDSIAGVRAEVLRVSKALGRAEAGEKVAQNMDRRLRTLRENAAGSRALYMTPLGATTGPGTLVHEMLTTSGLANFQDRPGWNPLPLERLAYERPDLVAAAFYADGSGHADRWSAARHPVARRQLAERPVVTLSSAWTACGGWFLVDAVEALARHRERAAE